MLPFCRSNNNNKNHKTTLEGRALVSQKEKMPRVKLIKIFDEWLVISIIESISVLWRSIKCGWNARLTHNTSITWCVSNWLLNNQSRPPNLAWILKELRIPSISLSSKASPLYLLTNYSILSLLDSFKIINSVSSAAIKS